RRGHQNREGSRKAARATLGRDAGRRTGRCRQAVRRYGGADPAPRSHAEASRLRRGLVDRPKLDSRARDLLADLVRHLRRAGFRQIDVSFIVRRSLLSVGISAAALYRSIERWHPTFVIDEADEAFVDNPDLRQVINSGWTRGQGVVR